LAAIFATLPANPGGMPVVFDINGNPIYLNLGNGGGVGVGDILYNPYFTGALSVYLTDNYPSLGSSNSQWKDVTGGIAYTWTSNNVAIGSNNTSFGKLYVAGKTVVGETTTSYLPSAQNWNYTLQLSGGPNTSIGFYDAANGSASSVRYNNNGFVIGGNDGWGVKPVYMPGNGYFWTANPFVLTRTSVGYNLTRGAEIDAGVGGIYLGWNSGTAGTHIGNGLGLPGVAGYGDLYARNIQAYGNLYVSGTTNLGGNLTINTGSQICLAGSCITNFWPTSTSIYDVNDDGDVNCQDVDFVRANSGMPITPANRKADVNNSNGINAADIGIIRNTVLTRGIACNPRVTWQDDGTNISYTGGNVGIWSANPTNKLEVLGGNAYIGWNVTANGFLYSSDRNLKKDITPLEGSLEKIMKLNGYSYNWKSTGKADMGVIAQEVETVYPDLVHTNTEGVKSVEYANLIAPLIEAVKTQQKEIESLKAEVASLKK
jgi:hypothetical protein